MTLLATSFDHGLLLHTHRYLSELLNYKFKAYNLLLSKRPHCGKLLSMSALFLAAECAEGTAPPLIFPSYRQPIALLWYTPAHFVSRATSVRRPSSLQNGLRPTLVQ